MKYDHLAINFSFFLIGLLTAACTIDDTPDSTDKTSNSIEQCALVDEHTDATISCPPGHVIAAIDFASYGLPDGSCDTDFSIDASCHANNSEAILSDYCVGQNSCSFAVSNVFFEEDPCPGRRKHLATMYTCESAPDYDDDAWSQCLALYASGHSASEYPGVLIDRWGRDITSRGLLLVDWEGPMGNPETTIEIAQVPEGVDLPADVAISSPGSPLLYFLRDNTPDENGPYWFGSFHGWPQVYKIGVNPDRDFESETYDLVIEFFGQNDTYEQVTVPVYVCDQDRDRPIEFQFVTDWVDARREGWWDGEGGVWDHNEDGIHDGVQARQLLNQIIDDVAYYLEPWSVDTMPVGGARTHVFSLDAQVSNTVPFDGFHLIADIGNSSTGIPGLTTHTRDGHPTDLKASGTVVVDIELPLEWIESNHVHGWQYFDGVSEEWWRASIMRHGPSPTGDCPEGQAECDFYATSFYSVIKHELLHTLAFEGGWPRWQEFIERGCIDDEQVMAYTGRCTPVHGVHAWDAQLHQRAWNRGIELLDKFEILVLQAVGWELRDTTPFVELQAGASELPNGVIGQQYRESLQVLGGVPAYRFAPSTGELPPGLTLDSFTGMLSGTPTEEGTYDFEVQVSDSGVGDSVTIRTQVTVVGEQEDDRVKVFILAGQSNMVGLGVVSDDHPEYFNGGLGNLVYVMENSPLAAQYTHLVDSDGNWVVRDDVWIRYVHPDGYLLAGGLSIDYGAHPDRFGPELQIGHVLGDHFDEPVLLIKTAWGGAALHLQDGNTFHPPSSDGPTGNRYIQMLEEVQAALDNLETDFPDYDGRGYVIAGLIWFQGWNDLGHTSEYEENLVNLIRDVRTDLGLPNLPVVIGETGNLGDEARGDLLLLRAAQAAAAAREEWDGTVGFVHTTDFARSAEESPNPTHGHHWFGNAESYFLVGQALGEGMIDLLSH